MGVRRFIIPARCICDSVASIEGEIHNHMVRVLRLGSGDQVELIDENATVYSGHLDQVDRERATVRITARRQPPAGSVHAPQITICQALPKGDKIDLILQKGTELGAHAFRLFGGRRSVVKVREEQLGSRLERWGKIAAEASRQCGRHSVPTVSWYPDAAAAASSSDHELRLILWEDEREQTLKQTLEGIDTPASVIVAIGPEGGFDPLEVECFSRQGFQPVSLGSRILRTETAGIAILAIMQYKWEDI